MALLWGLLKDFFFSGTPPVFTHRVEWKNSLHSPGAKIEVRNSLVHAVFVSISVAHKLLCTYRMCVGESTDP